MNEEILRKIPAINSLLNEEEIKKLIEVYPKKLVLYFLREEIDRIREEMIAGKRDGIDKKEILENVKKKTLPSLKRVINGVGIILHTGLGRAPYCKNIKESLSELLEGFCNLEINEENGRRGSRMRHIEKLLIALTGAEAGLVCNNNAAATYLILKALAEGKEVIISRGELIEIGGSFRLPDVMRAAGVILREVGTTNRTHLRDYEEAINENTALILKVHKSNYQIVGFTKEVPIEELAKLGEKYKIPVVDDLGSGAFIDFSQYGLPKEPVVKESIEKGASLVCFSGDKLLGGPQAGIIVGKKEYIKKLASHPIMRILRIDKTRLAILENTLRLFFDEERLLKEHEVIKMILKKEEEIKKMAKKVYNALKDKKEKYQLGIISGESEIGGGSLPGVKLKTYLLKIKDKNVETLARRLREGKIPIYGRIEKDSLLLDFRTIREEEIKLLIKGLKEVLN
ncbi:MAG: L-seryl-tRNA(Sec) selenium transferase [candidate division WOR-3 bacterium]|nr:L-seryl-tRNA(Sec) selenium transferase [candidate division WOR-3 bacterium]MDW8113679.1 L-seryl-tRNA(Sec) selenium transferase [candidate division WOR-3 bacterium]